MARITRPRIEPNRRTVTPDEGPERGRSTPKLMRGQVNRAVLTASFGRLSGRLRAIPVIGRRRAVPIMTDAIPLPFTCAEPSIMGMPHTAERWTADLVRALPDDGNRYELVSGELVMTPAPRPKHQLAVYELEKLLERVLAGTGLGRVLHSPADISLGEDEVLQPDL